MLWHGQETSHSVMISPLQHQPSQFFYFRKRFSFGRAFDPDRGVIGAGLGKFVNLSTIAKLPGTAKGKYGDRRSRPARRQFIERGGHRICSADKWSAQPSPHSMMRLNAFG
jgi:hypothetical protein